MGFLDILPWVLAGIAIIVAIALLRKQGKMEAEFFTLNASLASKEQELKKREETLLKAMEKISSDKGRIGAWKKDEREFDQLLSQLLNRLFEVKLIVVRLNNGRSIGLPEDMYLIPLNLHRAGIIGPAPEGKRYLMQPSQYSEEENFRLPIELTPLVLAPDAVSFTEEGLTILGEKYKLFESDA